MSTDKENKIQKLTKNTRYNYNYNSFTFNGWKFPLDFFSDSKETLATEYDFEEEKKDFGSITFLKLKSNVQLIWDEDEYNKSVKKSNQLWAKTYSAHQTIKENFPTLVYELWIAREVLRNPGTLTGKSFKGYLKEAGIPISTVYRWFKMVVTLANDEIPRTEQQISNSMITQKQIKYAVGLEKMRKALSTLTGQRTEKSIYTLREIVADKDFIIEMSKLVEKYAIKYNTMLSIPIPK